jgi:hypothetical protein
MLVTFIICQIIVFYVLMYTENWDYFVLDYFLAENRQDYYV